MKKLLLFILVSSCSFVHAQKWEWVSTFKSRYSSENIFTCKNEGVYIVGHYLDSIDIGSFHLSSPGHSTYLARFDTTGHCLWATDIYGYASADSDGQNMYVSTKSEIRKFSPGGSMLLTSSFENNGCVIRINKDKELIIAAALSSGSSYNNASFSDSTAVLLRLDSTLQMLAYQETSSFDRPVQLDIAIDNSIYLVANKFYPCTYCGVTRILKFSGSLSLQINHHYSSGVGSHYYIEPRVVCSGDELYVLQGFAYGNMDAKLYSSNLQKIRVWSLGWSGNLGVFNDQLYGCGVSRSVTCSDSLGVASVLMSLDPDLRCMWNKSLLLDNPLTGPGANLGNCVVDGSSVYVIGMIDKPVYFDSVLVSTSQPGTHTFIARLRLDHVFLSERHNEDAEPLKIFPNPGSSRFTVKSAIPIQTIQVSTLLGKMVCIEHVNSMLTELDLGTQPSGVYVVKVFVEGRYQVARIIKN